jgi:pimeloyl-ACP methyl ester carboxylesterase
MSESFPVVLVPGLLCSARLYARQIPMLWRFGPVMVAEHRNDDNMEAIARRILINSPPRFALAGLSMGGYIAFAIMRLAPERVIKLALLDTNPYADRPEQTTRRGDLIAVARAGRFAEIPDLHFPAFVHRNRRNDSALRQLVHHMAEDTGCEAYLRQQTAIMTRPDARSLLASITCPTLVLVGDGDELTPPNLSQEIAGAIPGAKLVVVPDCGHLSTLERPDEISAALEQWMQN